LFTVVYILIKEDMFYYSGVCRFEINYDTHLDKLLELRYLDDYMEEPIEIKIYKDLSCFGKFIDLFLEKSYKSYNLYSEYAYLTKYWYVNIESNIDSPSCSERPQVLSNILKYHLDVAYQNIIILNDNIYATEISRVRKYIIIWDALSMCKKALSGSPFIGSNSPLLEQNSSFNWSTPIIGNNSPIIGNNSPIIGHNSPFKWGSPLLK